MNPTTTGEANATTAALVREIAASHRAQRGALLPILHAVQEALGCVPPEAIPVLADELNLSRADVHGVVSFYHDFRSELTAEQVFCLGNCALGPAAQVNGRLHGRLDEVRLSLIIEEAVSQ